MMISGVGVDIISLEQMASSLENGRKKFIDRIFTLYEQEHALKHPQPIAYYAKIFAAKEAIVKCLGVGHQDQLDFVEIEIQENQNHQPTPLLYGKTKQLFSQRKGARIFLSLSYEKYYAIGIAVMEGL